MVNLTGQIALVTGGSRGLGEIIANQLADDGAIVIAASSKTDAAELPPAAPGDVVRTQLDVTDSAAVDELVTAIVDRYGQLDIAIANAGITRGHTVARTSDADWHAVLEVNLYGAVHLFRAALKPMRDRHHGRLIALSSVMAAHPAQGSGPYATSKAGIEALVRATAEENARHGITANAIAAGILDTGLGIEVMTNERLSDSYGATFATGKPTSARAVARFISFLADPDDQAINGQTIPTNGGLSVWRS